MMKTQKDMSKEEKLQAITTRNKEYDGKFHYGATTTKIYCNPSCPSRNPKTVNIVFFNSSTEAEEQGYRPCKRCRPDIEYYDPQRRLVQKTIQYIDDNINTRLTLSQLSNKLSTSPYHLQRTFKKITGMTPRQYIESRRLETVKEQLQKGETVTKAMYSAGFSSRSRLYNQVLEKLGMNPGTYRREGKGMTIYYGVKKYSIGHILVGVTEHGVCSLKLGDSEEQLASSLRKEFPAGDIIREMDRVVHVFEAVTDYLKGRKENLSFIIDVQGTPFQKKVWKQIQSIPYGDTLTYGKIAYILGNSKAARAVANACASNPVSLLIPCHRVLRGDGKLGGYAGGVERKQTLLEHEAAKSD